MARAAIALHEVSGEGAYLARAQGWVAAAEALFGDGDGSFFMAAADARDVLVRAKSAHDHAAPSGNGLMAEVLARLHHLTGDARYRDKAEALVRAFAGEGARAAIVMPRLCIGADLLERARTCVVAGAPDDPARAALLATAFAAPEPVLVVQQVAPGTTLPAGHPAAGKGPVGGQAAAYLCQQGVCGAPITDPAALAAALAATLAG